MRLGGIGTRNPQWTASFAENCAIVFQGCGAVAEIPYSASASAKQDATDEEVLAAAAQCDAFVSKLPDWLPYLIRRKRLPSLRR